MINDRVYNLVDFKHTGIDEGKVAELQSRLDKMFKLAQEIQDNF